MNTITNANIYRTHFDALCLACALALVAAVLTGARFEPPVFLIH